MSTRRPPSARREKATSDADTRGTVTVDEAAMFVFFLFFCFVLFFIQHERKRKRKRKRKKKKEKRKKKKEKKKNTTIISSRALIYVLVVASAA